MSATLRTLIVLGALALPDTGLAGAWMRERGAGFFSFGLDSNAAGLGQTLFFEYGAGPRLTLGLDGWRSPSGDWMLLTTAAFPLGRADGAARHAASLGAGVGHSGGQGAARLRLGLHAGRGLETGWLAGDVTATWRGDTGAIDMKATATWGRRFGSRLATVMEGRVEDGGKVSLAPSVVVGLGSGLRLRIGGAADTTGGTGTTVGLQTWLEF